MRSTTLGVLIDKFHVGQIRYIVLIGYHICVIIVLCLMIGIHRRDVEANHVLLVKNIELRAALVKEGLELQKTNDLALEQNTLLQRQGLLIDALLEALDKANRANKRINI